MTTRVLIADDEALARRRLHRLCGAMPDVTVVGECTSGEEVLARVAAGGVDVVLLDISMPGLSGVEAMGLWPADGPAIVFVTAHEEHALAAFDGGAVDYVLKPVEPARLAKALARVRRATPSGATGGGAVRGAAAAGGSTAVEGAGAAAGGSPGGQPLALETRQGVLLLRPDEVVAIVVDGASSVVHTDRGRFYTERPLSELETALAGRLERVHRGALLNLTRVRRFEPVDSGGYLAWTDLEVTVTVSRQVARELRRRWGIG